MAGGSTRFTENFRYQDEYSMMRRKVLRFTVPLPALSDTSLMIIYRSSLERST